MEALKTNYDKAIADYSEALKLDPKCTKALFGRGTARYYRGEYDEAIADYSEDLKIDPKDALAYFSRGCGMAHQRRIRQVHRRLQRGFEDRS